MFVPTEKHVNLSDDAIGTYFNTRPTCFTEIALQQYEICFVMSWYRTTDVHDLVSSVNISYKWRSNSNASSQQKLALFFL
jgi:hypothetical protein